VLFKPFKITIQLKQNGLKSIQKAKRIVINKASMKQRNKKAPIKLELDI
jgi:hypothetical protein